MSDTFFRDIAEYQLRTLRELTEIGMGIARTLQRDVEARADTATTPDAPPEPTRRDPAESFARVSRAIRLTLALEMKVAETLRAHLAGERPKPATTASATTTPDPIRDEAHAPPQAPPTPAEEAFGAHRDRVRDLVHDVINSEITDLIPSQEALLGLHERLTESEPFERMIYRPLRQSIDLICADLGLHPDWSRWTGEGWAPRPAGPNYEWQALWRPPQPWIDDPDYRPPDRRRAQSPGPQAAGASP